MGSWPTSARTSDARPAEAPAAQASGSSATTQASAAGMKPWEEVALSILQSLSDRDISSELATDWLRMILNYAELS